MSLAPPAPSPPSPERARGEGMLDILRFNGPAYAGAAALVAALSVLLAWVPLPRAATAAGLAIGAATTFFLVGSLAVAFWVYDASDLYRFGWLERIAFLRSGALVHLHAGYDETGERLRANLPEARWRWLDVFDPARRIAPSLARARRYRPPPDGTERAHAHALPLEDESIDAVLSLFAVHELREAAERDALAREVRRALRPGGAWIVAEHVRDLANFAAFGPGAFHFLPRRAWLATFAAGGLQVSEEFRVTPFVTVFVARPR